MSLSSAFVVGCSLQLRHFSPARPLATRARRLALAGLAVAALACPPGLPQPAADPPPAHPAGHTVHQEQP